MKDITDRIIKKHINQTNVLNVLVFAQKFENQRLIKACQEKVANIFSDIKAASSKIMEEAKVDSAKEELRHETLATAMSYLTPQVFAEILQRDDLNVAHEHDLVEHVQHYLKTREELSKATDLPPEKTVKRELWQLLTDDERKKRNDFY
jgi:hypothetical protein